MISLYFDDNILCCVIILSESTLEMNAKTFVFYVYPFRFLALISVFLRRILPINHNTNQHLNGDSSKP